jgi:membrane fusion protein (multidrug efflux system)
MTGAGPAQRRLLVRWAICLLLLPVGGFGGIGCERSAVPRLSEVPTTPHAAGAVVDVSTARVRRGSIGQRVSAPGTLAALRESHIGVEITGRVLHVFVSEGDRVNAGDPLFQIDPTSYEMALRQAEAGLDLARAERRQIEMDLGRARSLRRQDVVAQQDLDRLTTQLEVAQARERQADETLALARNNVERTLVRAPYDGSIAKRLVDEGTTALVQPQTVVVVLQETGTLEAQAAIPESQLALVQVGDPALLRIEGIPDPIETRVSGVNDAIDPATRTYLVTMRVPNPDRRLKAGVFALVEISPAAKADALLVPADAIRTEEGRTRVLAVRDGKAVAVPIDVGLASGGVAEVLRGVDEGEEVVVGDAARTIAPGMNVRVVAAPVRPPA